MEQRAAAPMSDVERKARLAQHVAGAAHGGWRVESQTDFQAVLVQGHRPNHLLHLILSVLTVGLWLIVWAILAIIGGEKRRVLRVDEAGNVTG